MSFHTFPACKIVKMPGGEWHPKGVDLDQDSCAYAWIPSATAHDLVCLNLWSYAVRALGGKAFAAIPYLPGARQDRAQIGEALSALVYAKLINAAKLELVIALDPHSDVMPALVRQLMVAQPEEILNYDQRGLLKGFDAVIAPDAGASKRAYRFARELGLPMFQAWKKRDPSTGKLSGFGIEPIPSNLLGLGRFLVVDDICDGGGTFKGLAQAFPEPIGPARLSLWTTHGIFSGSSSDLHKWYGQIFSTNSHDGSGSYMQDVRKQEGCLNNHIVLDVETQLMAALGCLNKTVLAQE